METGMLMSLLAWLGAAVAIAALIYTLYTNWPETFTASKCGHKTRLAGKVKAFEQEIHIKMPKNKEGAVDWCLDCVGNMTIQCAWCENPIFIGEPVTLYSPCDEFEVPEHAVVYNEDPLQLVGCLGWDCASTGGDRAGFWVPGKDGKGRVYRVLTPFEATIASGGLSAVIVSDTHDMEEAMNPTLISLEKEGAS